MTRHLSRSVKLWYGLGQLAEGLKNEAYAVFLLFYYTSVVGLSGTLAGQAILISLLFDAVTDPLVGAISDRLDSRWGRRHPLLFAAAIPLPILFYLSFAPPAGLSQFQLFLWLTAFTILTRGAMTLFHVPHLALGAELSDDFEERSSVVTLQYVFARVGAIITWALGLLVFLRPTPEFADGRFNPGAYPPFAFTLAVLMFVTILLSAWNTRSRIPHLPRPHPDSRDERPVRSLFAGMREAMEMRSFRSLFLGTLVLFVAWGVTVSLGLHLATYFWRVTTADLLLWGIATSIGVFAGLGYWLGRATAGDKKPVFMQGGFFFMVFTVVPPVAFMAGLWPALDTSMHVALWSLTTGFAAHFALAGPMVTGRSMMADVTDEDELRTGRRREGVFFGATSFAAKAFFGVGSQVAGWVFDFVGLEKGMTVADAPPTVVNHLGLTLVLSIGLLVGLAMLIFSRFDLTRERCGEMRRELDARREARLAKPVG